MNVFYIDYETTGLNPYSSEVIEIAIKKKGCEKGYSDLIKPETSKYGPFKYVPPHIVEITKITDDMIINDGIPIHEAFRNMYSYMTSYCDNTEKPIYLIAHNGTVFDFIIFKRLLKIHGKQTRSLVNFYKRIQYIDTVLLAKLFMKDDKVNQKRLCSIHRIVNENEHRAMGDVIALEKLFEKLCLHYSYMKGKSSNYYYDHLNEIVEDINIL